jgi:tetratricopeptide (TPR) repeat protein
MSRENWHNLATTTTTGDVDDWRQLFQHRPLKGRTTDPEAMDFDEASDLFLQGLKLARRGDLKAGRAQIATAYLLDTRSINWVPFLPEDHEARDAAMDFTFHCKLMEDRSYGALVLKIMAADYLGNGPEGQTFIGSAMKTIQVLLEDIAQHPQHEASSEEGGLLGGCMTRTKLLYHRSSLHMAMGNHNKAIKDLTKALKIDPKYTQARDARASLWACLELRDYATLHAEYNRIVGEVHPDSRGLDVAYGWLAFMTLKDSNLGTVQEAKQFFEKCLRAQIRREDLYGKRKNGEDPDILQLCKKMFTNFANGPLEVRKFRADCDAAILSGRMEDLQIPATMQVIPQPQQQDADSSLRHKCLKCGKTAADVRKRLSKCSRCKLVSYCSKDCQSADWKGHKVFCKIAANKKTPPALSPEATVEQETPKPVEAKTPISDMNGNARAAARMEDELRSLYQEFGNGFAEWWHEKTVQERGAVLLDMTNNTLPHEMPCPAQIHAELERGISSRYAFDCCVVIAAGPCGCAKDPNDHKVHQYPDRLLHELHVRTMDPKRAEAGDYDIVTMMRDGGVFPSLPGDRAIVAPNHAEGPEKHDIDVVVVVDACPEAEREKLRKMVTDGLVMDASVAFFLMVRKLYWLQLLIKLFDLYQEQVRRSLPTHPLERLRGCEYCHQTCEEDDAVRCKTCEVTWWCCQGCVEASVHGRNCPVGTPSESRVLFTW